MTKSDFPLDKNDDPIDITDDPELTEDQEKREAYLASERVRWRRRSPTNNPQRRK